MNKEEKSGDGSSFSQNYTIWRNKELSKMIGLSKPRNSKLVTEHPKLYKKKSNKEELKNKVGMKV